MVRYSEFEQRIVLSMFGGHLDWLNLSRAPKRNDSSPLSLVQSSSTSAHPRTSNLRKDYRFEPKVNILVEEEGHRNHPVLAVDILPEAAVHSRPEAAVHSHPVARTLLEAVVVRIHPAGRTLLEEVVVVVVVHIPAGRIHRPEHHHSHLVEHRIRHLEARRSRLGVVAQQPFHLSCRSSSRYYRAEA